MNVKQLFEELDTPEFVQFVYFRGYQCIDMGKLNDGDKEALKQFAKVLIKTRQDPEFWTDICKYAEEKESYKSE